MAGNQDNNQQTNDGEKPLDSIKLSPSVKLTHSEEPLSNVKPLGATVETFAKIIIEDKDE